MTHREIIKDWLSTISLSNVNVLDWGSGSKPVMRYIQHEASQFITIDNASNIPEDRKSNHLTLDISKPIGFYQVDLTADVAFCIEVLEHVEDPEQLVRNIAMNLKSQGQLYLTAPFLYPTHAEKDYWRFTMNGIELLLQRNGFEVQSIAETTDQLGWMVTAVKS